METGLIYVVFGDQCDRMAAHCVAYSRQYTKLPICILSNLKEEDRDKKWQEIENIDFKYMDLPLQQNRQIKTGLSDHSPFDYTIYLDADSIIQKDSFDQEILEMVDKDHDLILNHFCDFPDEGKFQNIYLRALKQFGCTMPLSVYNGAFIGFKKGENANNFFSTWNRLWKEFGAQREMPPLACTINKLPEIRVLKLRLGFFSPDVKNENCVVQHNYHDDFWQRIGISPVMLHQAAFSSDDYRFTVM